MKNTKTTMKELSAMYRSVLLKCFAIAAGIMVTATAAQAELTIKDVVDNAQLTEVAQPNMSDYTYTSDIDGTETAIDGTTENVDDANFAFAKAGDAEGTKSGNVTDSAYEKTAYTWTDHDGAATRTADETIDPTSYAYTIKNSDGSDATVTLSADNPENLATTDYQVTLSDSSLWEVGNDPIVASSYSYLDGEGVSHTLVLNETTGQGVLDEGLENDEVAKDNMKKAREDFFADVDAAAIEENRYNANNKAYQDELANLTADQTALTNATANWQNDNDALTAAQSAKTNAQASLEKANEDYKTANNAYAAYGESLSKVIDDKTGAATDALKAEAAEVFAQKEAWVGNTLGIDTTKADAVQAEYAGTTALKEATTLTGADIALDKAIADGDKALSDKIDAVVQQAQNTFDKKQQWVDDTLGITSANKDAVKAEYTGTTYLQDATTLTGADKALDAAIATNAEGIATNKADIAANKTAIGTNTANIATNADNIATNATNIAANTSAISTNTANIATNATDIATNKTNIAANTTAIQKNATDIGSLQTAFSDTKKSYDARFARMDNRIDDLEDDMKKGLASNAALASLVPLSSEHKTQISMGMGGYKDQQGLALGAFHYAADNILLNAGAAWGGDDNYSYKAGVTFGF